MKKFFQGWRKVREGACQVIQGMVYAICLEELV